VDTFTAERYSPHVMNSIDARMRAPPNMANWQQHVGCIFQQLLCL